MNNRTKIIIAISLPVLILIFIIGSVLFPRLFFSPKYDFIYTIESGCAQYEIGCTNWTPYSLSRTVENTNTSYTIEKNPLPAIATPNTDGTVRPPATPKEATPHYPKLYLYQVATDSFKEISLEDANRLNGLVGDGSAPDGTTISSDYRGHGGIFGELFGGYRYGTGLYLKNSTWNKEVTVRNGTSLNNYYDYQNNFRLISWVEPAK